MLFALAAAAKPADAAPPTLTFAEDTVAIKGVQSGGRFLSHHPSKEYSRLLSEFREALLKDGIDVEQDDVQQILELSRQRAKAELLRRREALSREEEGG